MKCLTALLALMCLSVATAELTVCYYSSWSVYRPGGGYFDIDYIDPHICTHIVYAFAALSNETWGVEVEDPFYANCVDDVPPGEGCAFDRLVALKNENPDLKLLLSVGGWNEGSLDFSALSADPLKRSLFVESAVAILEKEGFDGLDVDWEYPTYRGGLPQDRDNFILLLDDLRAAFDSRGWLLTAAVAQVEPTISTAYDVQGLVRNLDYFFVMTYDFHGTWETFTYVQAPVCSTGSEDQFPDLNSDASVTHWLGLGVPADKIVMGIPLYARCYTLDDPNMNGLMAPASQPGAPGPYTSSPGTQSYNEICLRLPNTEDCTVVMDPSLHEPYVYCLSDNIWCSYEDAESVTVKAQYVKSRGLAGAMVFSMDSDDFNGNCGSPSGLITAINDALAQPMGPNICA